MVYGEAEMRKNSPVKWFFMNLFLYSFVALFFLALLLFAIGGALYVR